MSDEKCAICHKLLRVLTEYIHFSLFQSSVNSAAVSEAAN